MRDTYRYLHFDVFTNELFRGNQLAVLPVAEGIDAVRMQQIAAEMAFSETTFVVPSDDPGARYRVRIFTPRVELPMAGHPTIGTVFALAAEGMVGPGAECVTFELGVGPTDIDLEWSDDELHFAWMRQPIPELGPVIEADAKLAVALGIDAGDLSVPGGAEQPLTAVSGAPAELRPQVVSSGVPFLFVPLRSRAAVDRVDLDVAGMRELFVAQGVDEMPVFTFSLEPGDDDATAYSRMFAPLFGIPEDPATGGASGPLGAYLVHHGAVAVTGEPIVSLQGGDGARQPHLDRGENRRERDRGCTGGRSIATGC